MLQEIAEQPTALARTIQSERPKLARLGAFLKQRGIDLIVLVARGSSDNAALFGRYLLEITTGIPVSLSAPSVHTLYRAKLKLQHALVVGVSQSGEGEDINQVLESARAEGAYTVGITNEPSSAMANVVDETLLMHGGRERSVAATKTFTGQMLLFYMLAEALAESKPAWSCAAITRYPRIGPTLRLHGKLRRGRAWTCLCKCVRACLEVNGNMLRCRRAFFIRRLFAWPSRNGGASFSSDPVRAAGSDVAGSEEFDRPLAGVARGFFGNHQ